MNVKAEAYQEWNQAAVVDKLLTNMADVVRAMAEPLSKVDKITIVSTGERRRGRRAQDHWRHDAELRRRFRHCLRR